MAQPSIGQAHPDVAKVLRSTSKSGVHLALMERLLRHMGYKDVDVVFDLATGFAFVDKIKTVPYAQKKRMRIPRQHSSKLQPIR